MTRVCAHGSITKCDTCVVLLSSVILCGTSILVDLGPQQVASILDDLVWYFGSSKEANLVW